MTTSAPSCMNVENGCVMFDCLTQLWDWIDPPSPQSTYPMENKQLTPATQQPLTQQQHFMAHHVHPDQIYSPQSSSINSHLTSVQSSQIQPNGVMHQLLQSQYHSNMNARSPLLENRQDLYGTTQSNDYARHYGANDNYNYPQSPPKLERTELLPDHNVNHELLQNMPKGYNAEVYQDYLKRNPPKDTNQIYQNHQHMYKSNVNQQQQQQQQQQMASKPYLPYSNRIGPQSNTELLRRQYNEIQQMKLQQQIHYQNQAQMHQQQKFAERQLLLQQIHGVQPPPNLQTSLYSDGSYRDLDRYSSKNDFREYSSNDIQKEVDRYIKNNEYREPETQSRYKDEAQWQSNQATDYKEIERFRRQSEADKVTPQSPQFEYNNQQSQRNNVGVVSPMKSSESSSPSVKSPSSDSRRSSGGNQALRSPVAQRTPSAPVAMAGILYKQGSDGLKVWRKRWFVLSEYCLFYYKSQDEQKLLGSVLLPSYKVSPCTSEDKVLKKFAFKLEHANMRTYILAAPDHDSMTKWVKVLTMAAVMQTPNENQQKQNERTTAKPEDDDDIPTYANAPPKPRRSNEGYNSPSSDIYDPNYDLLKKPAAQYSQSQTRYQDHSNYQPNVNQESLYGRSPQSPPPVQQQPQYSKRPYDTHQLTLPLTNTLTDKPDYNQPSTSANYRSNPQSPYFDNRNIQQPSNEKQEIYNTAQGNPFKQENLPQTELSKDNDHSKRSRTPMEQNKAYNEIYPESRTNSIPYKGTKELEAMNREIYGELNARPNRAGSTMNERLLAERRTPDAYGRSTAMSSYNNKDKIEDYEDVYAAYTAENEYGKTFHKAPDKPVQRDAVSISSQQQRDAISVSSQIQAQEYAQNYPQEKQFSGPSVLRRKKMQASGIQPPIPRPHSADFLEYETKNETLNRSMPESKMYNAPRQPPRPKSSLDINSYYDPSSDKYYSEESYAAKMRQSAQYLQAQQALGPRSIQTPLAKYASGLAEKQLNSPYSQTGSSAYDLEFGSKVPRENSSYSIENSNWTLKEKNLEEQKEYLNRIGSVLGDGIITKEVNRFDPSADGFIRSASARLPSSNTEKEGDKKVQQREESMKRLLEWKQRMLQSPLTRKSTPATISLARSLNQSRQSLRSDQYKSKSYQNASYNSYSSDDEEETSGTDLQKREMQAGRSHNKNLTSSTDERFITPHASPISPDGNEIQNQTETLPEISSFKAIESENTYENILCTITVPKLILTDDGSVCDDFSINNSVEENYTVEVNNEKLQEDSEESEAEFENLQEYTDNDLDEVLLEPECEATINNKDKCANTVDQNHTLNETIAEDSEKSSTPPVCTEGENHYLPMSPRKLSTIEPAHKTIIENLSVFNQSMPTNYEDNPYVEMNLGMEDEDGQTYEFVCVNNGKSEPVYMELNNVGKQCIEEQNKSVFSSDSASHFADTKEHTLKRVSKQDKTNKEKVESSDADDELSRDLSSSSLETPFSRFSISDNFRPASYYLNKNLVERQNSSDSEILSPPPLAFNSALNSGDFSDDALSKYILDKLDQSGLTQDNSILKMLTSENQNMNTVKRKATSLMIYGSRTSIHDTLTRGEKIRNSRASLTLERNKVANSSSNLLNTSIRELCQSSSIESDSLKSFNDDRGSSRLSLESDVSSKFDIAISNISSEVTSLNGSESAVELRNPNRLNELDLLMRRRPISEDSLELVASAHDLRPNIDLDRYLDNLQPSTSIINNDDLSTSNNGLDDSCSNCKDNVVRAQLQTSCHTRCSSTPVNPLEKRMQTDDRTLIRTQLRNSRGESSSCFGSQYSSSSTSIPKSPISYYCKNYDEGKLLFKNLNNREVDDKIREFEGDKVALKISHERNGSSTSTGFHSRESSTEHSAPYYYSDLSSQEHINIMPTSHFLKNTNVYRKLNNQRRRGPLHKKNEISHIHNPIRNNHVCDRSFELTAARSVSVEFLSAADKDTEIDLKNIYESSRGKPSKIPESMQLIGSLGCKINLSTSSSIIDASSPECSYTHRNSINANSTKLSSTSMSSHCSGNSSNTVYYDAEADTNAYENVQWHGEKHWDEDALWRDNLRRVSHRHARSMDDLDAVAVEENNPFRENTNVCGLNSIKRVKKTYPNKVCHSAVYVNCDIQAQILEKCDQLDLHPRRPDGVKTEDNDVYVSLAKNSVAQSIDEGLYEQLAVESSDNSLTSTNVELGKEVNQRRMKNKFEIDREKLRQWDLMSSGLMKGEMGRVREINAGVGTSEALSSMDTGTDSASNQASITIPGANIKQNLNNINNSSNQQTLSKKAFLGSNTSIGRANRETSIPVRAVSPRVRWVEEKSTNDHYGSQHLSASQHNLNTLQTNDDSWTIVRSPSRASQQPIRAVSPRVRRETQNDELQTKAQPVQELSEIPTAGELLGRTHEELVLLLIQLRRRHAATHRAMEQFCAKISCLESTLGSLKAMEREKSLQRLEQMKIQLLDLENQYEKSKPLVQLVDNMVKLGSLYNRPGSTIERLERNQRLREKVLTEHALEQQRWLESAAAGKSLETEAARARVAELWALEQELADEAAILQGLKADKGAMENLITDVRTRLDRTPDLSSGSGGDSGFSSAGGLEAELARVHAMLAYNSKQLEQTVQDNARLERELRHLRRALQSSRVASHHTAPAAAQLQDEVTRVQQLVTALQKQRQDLSRAVRHLTQQSQALQNSQNYMPDKHIPQSSWQETNLDTGHTTDHQGDYDDISSPMLQPGHYNQNSYDQNARSYGQNNHPYNPNGHGYEQNSHSYDQKSHVYEQNNHAYQQNSHGYQQNNHVYQQNSQMFQQNNMHNYDHNNIQMPLYVDTRNNEVSPEEMQNGGFANLSNVEKQEIKTVRIVKRESERRQRDRERSLQPMSDWSTTNISANLDQFIEEELVQSLNNTRASSLPRTDFSKFEEYYSKPQEPPNYLRLNDKNIDISPKFPSSPSLSNYDYSRDISSLSSSYNKSYDRSAYDRTISISTQYLNSPTDSSRTLTNDPLSKTSSVVSLTRSNMELSPIFKSEAAKQIITEMSDVHKNGSLHRRQVPKEKRRHYTAPHHLSAKTLNELPMNQYNQDKLGRSLDDADMERALRGAPAPDVVRSALPPTKFADSTIDQLLAAPQKIVIPERYIPEKPPELSPEEQQKRQEKVESIKKMLTSGTSADPNKSPDGEEKKQREHLLQMNQILAKQVTEMSKIIAVKALEELPQQDNYNYEDHSPDVELPIYQQRDNFFS